MLSEVEASPLPLYNQYASREEILRQAQDDGMKMTIIYLQLQYI